LNTLGGKVVYENTVVDRNIEDFVKLCQVGIEHMCCSAFEENSVESLKKTESLRSSVKLCQVGIEQEHRCTGEEDRTAEHSMKGKLYQVGIETV
jgi:hypothetical protein